jgi:archaellum component FlaG (FlaF/FlaG flagellin family)
MAGTDVIGTAICIALLVVVAYVVAGSIMTTAAMVYNSQNDMNMQTEERLNTAIQFSDIMGVGFSDWPELGFNFNPSDSTYTLHFHVKNTGLETIRNFTCMDVFVAQSGGAPVLYKFNANSVDSIGNPCGDANGKTWNYYDIVPDDMNPAMLDPGEELSIDICKFGTSPTHYMLGATTPNGVSAFYLK